LTPSSRLKISTIISSKRGINKNSINGSSRNGSKGFHKRNSWRANRDIDNCRIRVKMKQLEGLILMRFTSIVLLIMISGIRGNWD